jgi:hypothetical protein
MTTIGTAQGSSIEVGSGAALSVGPSADVCADTKTIIGTLEGAGTWCFGVLPVELTSFSARYIEGSFTLTWKTSTESNNYGFEIERRTILTEEVSAIQWRTLAFIPGHGTSNAPNSYSYLDNNVVPGRYAYRLRQIDNGGGYSYSEEVEIDATDIPGEMALEQNYPNPFNPTTVVSYQVSVLSQVDLRVFDMLGREVAVLATTIQNPGLYRITFDGSKLSSGIYLYRLTAGTFTAVKGMLLLK